MKYDITMLTIRQVVKHTQCLTEHQLRKLVHQGDITYIKVGNRVLINVQVLKDYLNAKDTSKDDEQE